MSKRDHLRKILKEQEATAHVFEEFVTTFQDAPGIGKTFVKSEVLYADKNKLTPLENQQFYNPTLLIKSSRATQNVLECAKILKDAKPEKPNKNKEKPKSNLELLKEELKQRHSEKGERERLKEEILTSGPALSYFEGGDPKSTNLFVANISGNITEADLMHDFGAFGPLASVKIMWPRGEDKFKGLDTNCGFVAYMSRRDAERSLAHLKSRSDMRVGWGKSVELPPHPMYVPPELLRLYLPPPQSGLPFNAQLSENCFTETKDLEADIQRSIVKVTIPLNRKVLMLVNRMVEFVVKEGPMFEAMIMNKELGNPDFNFLFENKSPTHVYYRWKLFSILQGEPTREWSLIPFRMFKGGSIWLPPTIPNFQAGMPEELINNNPTSTLLSDNQCERLIEIIQNLTLERSSIADAMTFCLNHSAAVNDSLDIIVDSFSNLSTSPPNKIARLYLLYDVLINCLGRNVKVSDGAAKLEIVVDELLDCYRKIDRERDKSMFGARVLKVLRQFETFRFLKKGSIGKFQEYFMEHYETIDEGNSSNDEPLDGASLLKRSLKNRSDECVITPSCLKVRQEAKLKLEYFVPSKWDALDPEEVEAQSVSSTQLYRMELEKSLQEQEQDLKCAESPPYRSKAKMKKRKVDKEDICPEKHSRKRKEKRKRRSVNSLI